MKQQPVSCFQSDLHRPHLFSDISRHALYHSLSQVRSDLRPGIRRDIDTAVHGGSHICRYLTYRIILHRVGDRYSPLAVRIVNLQFYRNNRTFIFNRLNKDIKPFTFHTAPPVRIVPLGINRSSTTIGSSRRIRSA